MAKYRLQSQKELGTKHLVLGGQGNLIKPSLSLLLFENGGDNYRGATEVNVFGTGVGQLLLNTRCSVNAGSPLSLFLSPGFVPSGGGLGHAGKMRSWEMCFGSWKTTVLIAMTYTVLTGTISALGCSKYFHS